MMGAQGNQKVCYVIMGFGKKTDFETGRFLDLDKAYKNLIKPAVEKAGLTCVRADEIVHSGLIDLPMYDQILNAELVIADLSTSNKNAFYELGIRHALRPYGTIIISEDGIKTFPFDVGHVPVRQYHHLGEGIDFDEMMRFQALLVEAIQAALANQEKIKPAPDSPLYALLPDLQPPALRRATDQPALAAASPGSTSTLAAVREKGEQAIKERRFSEAKALFLQALELAPNDYHLMRQHILATYKAMQPDPLTALIDARKLLTPLSPDDSTDRETLELLGDVELALFEANQGVHHLARARGAYEKIHAIKQTWHSSITLAYLVTQHAEQSRDKAEKIADVFEVEQLRREAVEFGKQRLAEINILREHKDRLAEEFEESAPDEFRVWGAIAEAYYGLGDTDKYNKARDQLVLREGGEEALKSLDERTRRLNRLLASQGGLLAVARSLGEAPDASLPGRPELRERGMVKPDEPEEEKPVRDLIFISYSHQDAEWLEKIKKILTPAFRNKNISLWDDGHIQAGKNWRNEIKNALTRAAGAVLLVSTDFLASEFIADDELPYIFGNAESQGVVLLWVAIDDCLYEGTELERYQCLNDPKSPLVNLDQIGQSRELAKIARKIRDIVFPP